MKTMPYVTERTGLHEKTSDVFSRLINERIIMLGSEIDDYVSNSIVAQLLHLEQESSTHIIDIYINSPGGEITSGLAIYDTMQLIKAPVRTICIGMAASMASVLLAAGAPGKRHCLPNSQVMIHQPLGGARGQATDIEITAKFILRLKKRLNLIMAHHTSQKLSKINKDVERDYWLTAEEAVEYGIVDSIISRRD